MVEVGGKITWVWVAGMGKNKVVMGCRRGYVASVVLQAVGWILCGRGWGK